MFRGWQYLKTFFGRSYRKKKPVKEEYEVDCLLNKFRVKELRELVRSR